MFKKLSSKAKKFLCGVLAVAMCMTTISSLGAVTVMADPAEGDEYTVTLAQTEGGTIAFDGIEGDTASFAEGDEVALSVTPEDGYVFNGITLSDTETGDVIAEDDDVDDTVGYTFTMPAEDITATASFEAAGKDTRIKEDAGDTPDDVRLPSEGIATLSNSDIATFDVKQNVKNVATVMDPGTGYGGGTALPFAYENIISVETNSSANIEQKDDGNYKYIGITFSNAGTSTTNTFSDPVTITYDCGTVGDEEIYAELKVTSASIRDKRSGETGDGLSNFYSFVRVGKNAAGHLSGTWFYGGNCTIDVTYELTLYKAGTNKTQLDMPCWLCVIDLDTGSGTDDKPYEQAKIWNSYVNEYLVWSDCILDADTGSGTTTFRKASDGVMTNGDEEYYKSGLIAALEDSSVKTEIKTSFDTGNELFAYTIWPDSPEKEVTSSQSNYQTGDEVTFTVTQTMPKFYEDTFECFESMTMYDVLPSGLTYKDESATMKSGSTTLSSSNFSYSNNTLTYDFSKISNWLSTKSNYNGQTLTMTFTATVTGSYKDGSTAKLTNTAYTEINGVNFGPATAVVNITSPKLSISKSVDKHNVNIGDSITYTINVRETVSNATAQNVTITDTIPSNLTVTSVTSDIGTVNWSSGSNDFTVTKSTLSSSETIKVTVTATVNSYPSNNQITNTAYANADNVSQVQDSVDIAPTTNFTATKTTDKTTYYVGDTVYYTITVNTESDLYHVYITDDIPNAVQQSLTLVSVKVDGVEQTPYVDYENWTEGNVEFELYFDRTVSAGSTIEIVYSCKAISKGTDVTNHAKVCDDGSSDKTAVNMYAPIDILAIDPELNIEKAADKNTYNVGDTVTYTVKVTQTKEDATNDAQNVYVNDILPNGLTNLKETTLSGVEGTVYDTDNPSVYIPTLKYGETAIITIKAQAESSAAGKNDLINTATATASNANEVSDNATIEVFVPDPALTITKDSDADQYEVGDTVTYYIDVEQVIDAASATNTVVSDTLPEELQLVSATSSSGGTVNLNTERNSFTVTYPSLTSGDIITVTATALKSGTNIINTATAKADNASEVSSNAEINISAHIPGLSVLKEADAGSYSVGDTVTYTITVGQTEEDAVAENVTVTDTLPEQLTYVSATSATSGVTITNSGNNGFTASCGDLAYGDTIVITVTATATTAGTGIVNTATANADNADQISDNATVTVLQPVLSIEKKADATTHNVGETVIYTITVKQTTANATAKNVVVSDTLPSQLELIDATASSGTVNKSNNGFTANIGDMTDSDTVTITVTAIAKEAGSGIKNTATAKGDNTGEVSNDADITVLQPGLSIVKTADKTSYYVGDTITYTIVVSQTVSGATATGVTVTDTLPTGLTYVDNSASSTKGSVSVSGSTITADIGSLAYGESATIEVKAIIGDEYAGGSVSNTAKATYNEGDDVDSTVVVPVAKPDISITKNVDGGPYYNVGDEITYTLEVKATNAPDTGIVVTDELPGTLTDINASISSPLKNSVNVEGHTLTAEIPSMDNGETVTITVKATISADAAGESITNEASVKDDYNNTDKDDVTISVLKPDVEINKSVSAGPYNVGDTITYTLTVSETVENAVDYNVVVTDTLPDELTLKSVSGDGNPQEDGNNGFTATIDTLSDKAATITVTATINSSAAGKEVTNTGYVTDTYGNSDEDSAEISVLKPDISITKTVSDGPYNVGDTITYTLTVTEIVADAVDFNIKVSDTLPDGVTATGTYTASSNANAEMNGNTLTATIDELAYGDTATFTIEATIDEETYGHTIENIAIAEDPYNEPVQDEEDITVATPAVSIVKTSDKDTYDVGETAVFTIEVTETNTDAIAYNLEVTDDLPAGLEMIGKPSLSSNVKGDVNVDGQSFTVTITELDPGQTATITVEATVGASLAGEEFTNIAVVEGPGIVPKEDDVTDDVIMPGVKIEKSVDDSKTYNVRDAVTYTLTVTNPVAGSHTTGVVVTDTLPDCLDYVEGSVTISSKEGADCSAAVTNGVLTANVGTLTSTDTVTITLDAVIDASALNDIESGNTNTVINTAYVTDYYGNNDNDSASIKVIHPDLKVTKSIGEGPFNVGDVIDYTLTLKESVEGAISYDVYLEDDLPEGLSATGHIEVNGVDYDKAYVDGDSYVVSIPVLNYGETATVIIEAKILPSAVGKDIDNDVYAWDSYYDTDLASARLHVEQPVLDIDKTADGTWYSVDDTVTYTITVNETTDGAVARSVVVTDTLPDELELINVTADMDGDTISDITTSGNSFTVNAGDMWVDNTVTVTVTAKALTENESIINTAYANADYTEEVNDDWKIAVRRPDIAITKDADAKEYYPGDTVTYTVTVENRMGDAEAADPDTVPTAYNVRVWDTVPEELELVSVSDDIGSTFTIDGNYFETSYPTMYYGETHVITVTATAYDVGNKTVDNIAYVVSDTTDELDDYAEIDIIKPIMSIDKEVDNTIHSVGEDVIYTIDVTQTVAGLTAYNVAVNDTVPDELTLKDAELEGVEGEVTIDGNSFTVDIPELKFGETAHITVTAEAIAPLDGVKNVAVVTADHADPEEDEVTHDILQPVLDIEKTADAASYNVGDTVTYTIRAEQTTENAVAYNVVVSDTLPEGLQLVDVTTSGVDGVIDIGGKAGTASEDDAAVDDEDATAESGSENSENSFTVTYESLSDTAAYITVTALVTGDVTDDTITNIATVSADNAEPAQDDADIYVMQPVLTIEKTTDKEKYFVGDTATYTIKVAQTTENATAYDVVVEDTLPDGLELTNISADGADETAVSENSLTVSYNELSDSRTITVTAKVLEDIANSTANNIATVSASNAETVDDNANIYVMQPALSIDKTSDKETYDTGETATFTVKIAQTVEGAVEENVVMTDAMPDGLTLTGTPQITGVEGGITVDGNTVTAAIPELAYGDEATVTIRATVGDELAGKSVTNTAYVKGDHTDEISDDATIKVNEAEAVATPNDPDTTGTIGPKTGQSLAAIIATAVCGAALATIVILVRRRRRT